MKSKRAYWLRAALLALIGILSASQMKADGEEGFQMRSSYDEFGHMLYLEWMVTGETQPVKFELYQFNDLTKSYSDLTLYSELTPDSSMTTEYEGKQVTIYADAIAYNDSVPATLYIKATYADGSVKNTPLNFLDRWVEPDYDKIQFTTEPPLTAKLGVEYIYDVNAEAESGKEISYSLIYGPDGAAIDEHTGKITWTPQHYGKFHIQVMANTVDDGQGLNANYQFWVVTVQKCEKLATITGTIKDQNGNLLEYGFVELVAETDSMGYSMPYSQSEIHNGKYELKDVDEGDYYIIVYIKDEYGREPIKTPVTVGCNEKKTVDITVTAPDMSNKITITSLPETHVKLNHTYTYDVEASAQNADLNIKYLIMQGPEGATIDEHTGVVTWQANIPGVQTFVIQAYAEENEGYEMLNDYQGWQVNVIQCETPSTLTVNVKFEDDKPLQAGHAYLFSNYSKDSVTFSVIAADADIKHGEVKFENVDKGTYYLMVDDYTDGGRKDYYYQHWYENAYTIEEATPIVIDCNEQRSITMTLTAPPEPNYYTVSGRVTDKDGNPIEHAIVELYADKVYKLLYPYDTYYQAYTDAEGKYSIRAADGAEYLAVAYIMPDSMDWSGQYFFMPIYYNQTTDPAEAERLKLTADRNDINFILPELPHFENSVSGKITDENDMPMDESYVLLYLIEPTEEYSDWMYYGFATRSNADGSYEATNLIPGKYIAFAFTPRREHAVPGYYKEGYPSTQNWEDATLIVVGENSDINNINIKLEDKKGLVGVGRIDGKIYGDEKKQVLKGSDDAGANPIAGANVYAINEQGEVAGAAQTDSEGGFLITGLSKGTYTLSIDKVGYVLSNVQISLSDDNAKSNAEVNIHGKQNGVNDKPELASATVSPNPAAETLRLDFQAEGATSISILNTLGEKVYTSDLGSLNGFSTRVVNLGSIPQGSYYVIVESGKRASVLPVIIIK
ncbi:MAG: carboxypeptidase regulatory-like domain-containing protein [Chloroflexota bacterium]